MLTNTLVCNQLITISIHTSLTPFSMVLFAPIISDVDLVAGRSCKQL